MKTAKLPLCENNLIHLTSYFLGLVSLTHMTTLYYKTLYCHSKHDFDQNANNS